MLAVWSQGFRLSISLAGFSGFGLSGYQVVGRIFLRTLPFECLLLALSFVFLFSALLSRAALTPNFQGYSETPVSGLWVSVATIRCRAFELTGFQFVGLGFGVPCIFRLLVCASWASGDAISLSNSSFRCRVLLIVVCSVFVFCLFLPVAMCADLVCNPECQSSFFLHELFQFTIAC